MFTLPVPDVQIVPLLLLGLGVGVLSGFTGVGGGFVVTPALIILGVPAELAVGTSLFWVFLNSLAGSLIHRNRGNVDIKLGICLSLPGLFGVEAGARLAGLARQAGTLDVAILSLSIVMMLFISTYTLAESLKQKARLDQLPPGNDPSPLQPASLPRRLQAISLPPRVRFARSGITISLWIILLLGFIIGILTGFVGIGGGFIIVPALTYVVGIPSILAAGSSTINVAIASFYGGARYLLAGSVVIPLALILLSTSIPGVIFGASVTRHVRGLAIRLILGIMTLIVCFGSILKLTGALVHQPIPVVDTLATLVTFVGILLPVLIVVLLKWYGWRLNKGRKIPGGLKTLFRK